MSVRRFISTSRPSFLRQDDLLGVVPVQVEQVRRVRRGDDLDGRPRLAAALRVAEPVERVLQVSEQSGVQPAVDLLQADQRRRVGQVRQSQQGKGDQGALRQVLRRNAMPPFFVRSTIPFEPGWGLSNRM